MFLIIHKYFHLISKYSAVLLFNVILIQHSEDEEQDLEKLQQEQLQKMLQAMALPEVRSHN